jgi:hypothetical protein
VRHVDRHLASTATHAKFKPLVYRRPCRAFVGRLHKFIESAFLSRGYASAGPKEGMLTMHAQLDHREDSAVPLPEVITALKNLYLVSSAAAQRGAYALEVRDAQWRALALRIEEARGVLDQQIATRDTHTIALLRQLAGMCEDLLNRQAARQDCSSAVWREVGRLGRDAYEYINLTVTRQ